MIHICIAKYKEDISWCKNLNHPYTVYDKSKDIPNLGREAETYLRYIVENYTKLPNYVVFIQGMPTDHLSEPTIAHLNKKIDLSRNTKIALPLNKVILETSIPQHMKKTFVTLFDIPLPDIMVFTPGAQLIVPRECILCRPLEFYETIINVLRKVNNTTESSNNCLVCPWSLERMWLYIFDPSIPSKQIKYEDLL